MRRARQRLRRILATASLALAAVLVHASAAMAADGEGLWGRTDDKVITFFAFGVMAFFTILVIVLSLIQGRLEAKKDRRKQELDRIS